MLQKFQVINGIGVFIAAHLFNHSITVYSEFVQPEQSKPNIESFYFCVLNKM